MTDPYVALTALLQPGSLEQTLYPPTSRYHAVATAVHVDADGRDHAYLRRRFVPQPGSLASIDFHTVAQGDRVDLIAASHFGDPEQFWRMCDANAAIHPDALVGRVGRRLRITLPGALPGDDHG